LAQLKEIDSHWYEEALDFCRKHPFQTVYLAHWISEKLCGNAFGRPGWLLGEFDQNHKIIGLAFISETGILFPVLHSDECFAQIEAITRTNRGMIRVILGENEQVNSLWSRLQKQGLQSRIDRIQTMYSVNRQEFKDAKEVLAMEIADLNDLDELVKASAAMAKEESGDDAQARNPTLFRERVEMRLKFGRDFIYRQHGELAFKASVSALVEHSGQIEGIYTVPHLRRRGLGRRGTAFLSRWILKRAEASVLLVNRENNPAKKIYESLGYSPRYDSRTIFINHGIL